MIKNRILYEVCAAFLIHVQICTPVPLPIQFSIPESKIVKEIPQKNRDFAFIVPGQMHTYIYNDEASYYKGYQDAYFAVTTKKAGWDCMRHYEILANGCIPYFVDIESCHPNTMYFLSKELIKEAMNLPGVSYLNIDHSKFDRTRYYEILSQLLEYTREYLTTRAMAQYILDTVHYKGTGSILFLSHDLYPDFLREFTLIGLKELFGARVVDFPKVPHVYKNYTGRINGFGKGFTYTKILDDIGVDRTNIRQRIQNKEFDLIIYSSVHRGLKFHELVCNIYEPEKIIYLCGEDYHRCGYANHTNLFLREFDALTTPIPPALYFQFSKEYGHPEK